MKKLGRRHRPFYRICAMDGRTPRDGRVLEELGTYDPMIPLEDARVQLAGERVKHWLSVGALPTEKVGVLIKKYGPEGTHLEQQKAAVDRLAQMRRRVAPAADLLAERVAARQAAQAASVAEARAEARAEAAEARAEAVEPAAPADAAPAE
jgi:small subunit ribosomal protein S16